MTLLLAVMALPYIYFNYSQAFIQIGYGANPSKLLERHLIGYYVGTSLDSGPELIMVDDQFLALSGLDKAQIQVAVVAVMTMVGINDSFADRLSLVPIPQSATFISVNLTFQIKNEQVSDTRVKYQAPTMLGIILPAVMAPTIRNLGITQHKFTTLFEELSTIQDFTVDRIEDFTARILHELMN